MKTEDDKTRSESKRTKKVKYRRPDVGETKEDKVKHMNDDD